MNATRLDARPIAEKYGITEKEVCDIYESVFQFIHNKIKETDYIAAVQDDTIRTSFQIPNLGKLYCDKDKTIKYLKKWKKLQ